MVELIFVRMCLCAEGTFKPNDRRFFEERRAREIVDTGAARLYRETKPAAPAEKKSSGPAVSGTSTAGPKSAASGKEESSAASAAAPASRKRTSSGSGKRRSRSLQ